jgi:hypothetical protein
MCDSGHDPDVPYAYMVSDGETGDTVALCGWCFLDFAAGVLRGAGYTVTEPIPAPAPPESSDDVGLAILDRDGEVIEPGPGPGEVTHTGERLTGVRRDEPAHRARTRRKLAARPDAASSSAAVVDFPQTGSDATD